MSSKESLYESLIESFPIEDSNWSVEIREYAFKQNRVMVTDGGPCTPHQF